MPKCAALQRPKIRWRGGAAGGRGSTRPAPRLRVGSQGGISDAIVPGGGTVPGTSLMKLVRPPASSDYPLIGPAVSTIVVENTFRSLDPPPAALDQLDRDHGAEGPDGRQRRSEQGPGRLAPHDRPEDQRAESEVADAVQKAEQGGPRGVAGRDPEEEQRRE